MSEENAVDRAAALAAEAENAEKSQDMLKAVRLIGQALELEPRDGERRLRRAFWLTCVREYDEARADLALVPRDLPPGDPRPARALANLEYVQGRFTQALDASSRIANPYYQDLFVRGLAAAKAGRHDEAKRALDGLRPSQSGWTELLDACQKALRDDWQGATAAAERSAAAAKPIEQPARRTAVRGAFALKAWKERTAPAPKKTESAKGRLRLISLGVEPPRNLTLNALEAMRDCDVLFVNIASDTLMDLVACFCRGEIRPINFIGEEARRTCAREILKAVAPGRIVGYASYGHVMMLGPLTMLLTRMCRNKGIEFTAVAGVSAIDNVLAESGVVLGDGFGSVQLYAENDLALADGPPLNARAALAVYLSNYHGDDRAGYYARLQEILAATYGAPHEALLFEADGTFSRLKLGDIARLHKKLNGRQQLFVPPVSRTRAAPRWQEGDEEKA